jgi:hypothetical protein
MKKFIIALFSLLIFASTSFATSYYVMPAGGCTNNGNGLASTCAASTGATGAFKGFSNVVWGTSGVHAGDTLYLIAGQTYSEGLTFGSSGTSWLAPVTVSGPAGSGTATISGHGFDFGDHDWVIVDGVRGNAVGGDTNYGLKFTGLSDSIASVYAGSSSNQHLKVLHVDASGLSGNNDNFGAITLNGNALDYEIAYNWVHSSDNSSQWAVTGILSFSCSCGGSTPFTNVKIHHNKANNFQCDGLKTCGCSSTYNNDVSHIEGSGHSDSIICQNAQYCAVYNNYIHNSGDQNIYVDCFADKSVGVSSCDHVWIFNNVLNSVPGHGIIAVTESVGLGTPIMNDVRIYNNTIYATSSYNVWTGQIAGSFNGIDIANNIFNRNTDGSYYSLQLDVPSSSHVTGVDYDVYGTSCANCPQVMYDWSGILSFAQFQSAGYETHGYYANPTFVSSSDYHLASSDTAARSKGKNLTSLCTTMPALCYDKDGIARPASGAWNIGAYEGGTLPPLTYSLLVASAGTGIGTDASSVGGIDCGSTCSASYPIGTVVTLTATPASGSIFAGWGGSCSGTGTCTLTMDSNKSVTATFTLIPPPSNYSLTIVKSGTGTGAIISAPTGINCGSTCSASYSSGTLVTLSASAISGTFSGWSGGGCSGTGTCVVNLTANTTITATFAPPVPPVTYILTLHKSGTGSGTVNSSPTGINCGSTCSASYSGGQSVVLTATPSTGSSFAGWSGGGCAGSSTCTVSMNASKTVTATFTFIPPPTNYTLTVLKAGVGTGYVTSSPSGVSCGVSCSYDYSAGTVVTLTATPDSGKVFSGWSGAGCSGTGTCKVTLNATTSVTANFGNTPRRWGLHVHKGFRAGVVAGNGTVVSSPTGINCGDTCQADYDDSVLVTLTATPDSGSTFTGWEGDCTGAGNCITTMDADKTVTADFSAASSPPPSDDGGSSGSSHCFIATAAYGSYLDPHVYVLRNFRDRYLLTNSIGQVFVNSYYRYSPPLAVFISKHETLRIAMRWTLTPIVGCIEHPYFISIMLIAGLVVIYRRGKIKR